jgi:gas vesicle protein
MDKQNALSYLKGILIGGIVGAATAMLLVPQSGPETRSQMREQAAQLRQKAEASYAEMQSQMDKTMSQLRASVDDMKVKVDKAVSQSRARLAKEVQDVGEQIAPE